MFVGHYAAALAAKAAAPRAPLWAYVAGCQLMDIGWGALVIAGVERFRFDPALPGSPLDLYFMPYTHSLPGSLVWSLAWGLAARFLLRAPWGAAAMVGASVFSHWLLDLLVHRPDLALWPGGPKLGLAMWNMPISEMALELGLVAIAGGMWIAKRKSAGLSAAPAIWFLVFLTALQVAGSWPGTAPSSTAAFGATAVALYLVATLAAVFADRGAKAKAATA